MLAYIYHCIRPPLTRSNSPVQHHSNRKKDTMNLLFICIAVQLLFLCSSINAAENDSDSCIRNYEELRRALRDNETNNIATLFNAFHPPNSQEVQVAGIMYCIGDNKTFCSDKQVNKNLKHMNYTFRWAANALLFVQEYKLINALVFDLFQFNYVNISLIINPPFCDDVSEKDKIDYLRSLTTWLKYHAHYSHCTSDNDLLQGYAVHLNDEESTFDITVYGKIEKLHHALLALQYTAVAITFITLLLRICFRRSADKINKKLERLSNFISGITDFIQGIKKDLIHNNCPKIICEYTIPYLLALAIFIGWDWTQYKNAEKMSKTEWFFFFPMPCIAPMIIGLSFGIAIVLFIYYCTGLDKIVNSYYDKDASNDDTKWDFFRLHDIVHFPILTGLSVFFIFHGSWMLLMLGAYPKFVIIRSLFLLPLFFFIITLLPRSMRGIVNQCYMSIYKCNICETCKKCKTCRYCDINISDTLTTLSNTITTLSNNAALKTLSGAITIFSRNITKLNITLIATTSGNDENLKELHTAIKKISKAIIKLSGPSGIANTITKLNTDFTKLNTILSVSDVPSNSVDALIKLNNAITAFNTTLNDKDLTTLNTAITTLSDAITALNTILIGSSGAALTPLSDDITRLSGDITRLSSAITKLDTTPNGSTDTLTTLNTAITTLSDDITTLNTLVKTILSACNAGTLTTLSHNTTELLNKWPNGTSGCSTTVLTTLITKFSGEITTILNTESNSTNSDSTNSDSANSDSTNDKRCDKCKNCERCDTCNTCKKVSCSIMMLHVNCQSCINNAAFNIKKCCLCKLKLCRQRKDINDPDNDTKCFTKFLKKDFTTIYGFIMTLAFAIPLLIVLYYGSDYILVVTNINESPLTLLLAVIVILGVPYYLILLWDNDIPGNKNTPKDHQPPPNNRGNQPPPNNRGNQPPPNNRGDQPPPNNRGNQPPPTNRRDQPPPNNGEQHVPLPNDGEQQDALANVT